MDTEQTCRVCGTVKPIGGENSGFSKDSKRASGWRTICRKCDALQRKGQEDKIPRSRRTGEFFAPRAPVNPAQLSFDDLLNVPVRRVKQTRDLHYIPSNITPFPDRKYNIIYADPPWPDSETSGDAVHTPYPTMSSKDLLFLPVETLAEQDCVLFMWTTNTHLPLALDLIEAWGFQYCTIAFVWLKTHTSGLPVFNRGYWTHGSTEYCLMARRGRVYPQSRAVRGLVISPREEHSKKPSEVRALITKLVGEMPRIELFARHRAEGWDSWGLEAPLVCEILPPEGLETVDLEEEVVEDIGGVMNDEEGVEYNVQAG